MAHDEPEVAWANLCAAKAHYDKCLQLRLADHKHQETFRLARLEWNLALEAYWRAKQAWQAREEETER